MSANLHFWEEERPTCNYGGAEIHSAGSSCTLHKQGWKRVKNVNTLTIFSSMLLFFYKVSNLKKLMGNVQLF